MVKTGAYGSCEGWVVVTNGCRSEERMVMVRINCYGVIWLL